jgi:hypothetical protein
MKFWLLYCLLAVPGRASGAPPVAGGPGIAPLRAELAKVVSGERRERPPEILEDGAVDLLRMRLEVELGDDGRTVDATAVLTVRTNASTGDAFYLWLDRGLAFRTAAAEGTNVRVETLEYPPFMYGVVGFSPRLEAGHTVDVTITYGGVLACEPYGPRASQYCGGDGSLSYYMASGLFPLFMDYVDAYGGLLYDLDLTLRTPAGLDLLVAADPVSDVVDGGRRTTVWTGPDYTSGMNLILLTGRFETIEVPGVTPPSAVKYPQGNADYAGLMADWMPSIYGFLEELAGGPFPFGQVTVFKLPVMDGFPGTATYGTVYLSDAYTTSSMQWFEEILAHEISHLWWGILAAPSDLARTALTTEGLAITSQYEYIRRRYYPDLDRDWVLWSKFRNNQLLLWYLTDPETLPPVLLPAGTTWPETLNEQVVWAYYKSSAFLDLLRVALGEDAFFGAIRDYVAACAHGECTLDDVEDVFAQSAQVAVAHLFDAFARESTYADLELGFVPCAADADPCVSRVTLVKDVAVTLPVELVLEDAGGVALHRELVQLEDPSADFAFTTVARAARARVNPRQQIFYRVRSAIPGDVDFDGETDGFDWVAVVLAHGRRAVRDVEAPGLYDVDLLFDTRLDLVVDGVVDDADLEVLRAGFGAAGFGAAGFGAAGLGAGAGGGR